MKDKQELLKTLIIDQDAPGGQMLKTDKIENYLDTDVSDYSTESTKTKIQNLPLRSIFIRNNSSLDDTISKFEQIYNFDGHKRFIVVDKNDETKPHTLLEAIKIAKEDYSSQNPEFKRNNQ